MHFNENPGKPKLWGLRKGSGGGSPSLSLLICSLVFIIPCNSPCPHPPSLELTFSLSLHFSLSDLPQRSLTCFLNTHSEKKSNAKTVLLSHFLFFPPQPAFLSLRPLDCWSLLAAMMRPYSSSSLFLDQMWACQVGSSCRVLSVALGRINGPAAIIWLYKDKTHTLSLTLHLFLKHVWTDRLTQTHTLMHAIVLLHKCSAMPSSPVVKNRLAAS